MQTRQRSFLASPRCLGSNPSGCAQSWRYLWRRDHGESAEPDTACPLPREAWTLATPQAQLGFSSKIRKLNKALVARAAALGDWLAKNSGMTGVYAGLSC